MGPFVDAAWLTAHLAEVVVCEVRWSPDAADGRDAYAAGHLPGAVHVDLDRDLSGAPGGTAGRHPLPPPDGFAATLGRLGIGPGAAVVAHDDGIGALAARLVWMLRVLGQDAALLDGGVAAWRAAGGTLEEGVVDRPAVPVPVRPWPPRALADADAVATAPVVLDARDAARHAGASSGPDVRAGRIAGSRHVPVAGNVDTDGLLLPDDALRALHTPHTVGDEGPVSSCGSGVTACHTLLVREHLGLPVGRLYPGSWSGWSADPARPVATGPA